MGYTFEPWREEPPSELSVFNVGGPAFNIPWDKIRSGIPIPCQAQAYLDGQKEERGDENHETHERDPSAPTSNQSRGLGLRFLLCRGERIRPGLRPTRVLPIFSFSFAHRNQKFTLAPQSARVGQSSISARAASSHRRGTSTTSVYLQRKWEFFRVELR